MRMGPVGPRHSVLAAVLLIAPTLATCGILEPQESIPISLTSSWEVKPCLRLQGSISVITETESTPISDIVPHGSNKNVHVCGNCDPSNPYLMLRWSNDKFLVLFFVVEESLIKTFRLDQVQYLEDSKLWYSDIAGIRGAFDGRVSCAHDWVIPLEFDEKGNETYHCGSLDPTLRRSGSQLQSIVLSNDGQSSDGNQRNIKLQKLSIMYAENISHTPSHETSCQKEPDLTITLAVSGVLSAAVLIGMAGAAMLLCV